MNSITCNKIENKQQNFENISNKVNYNGIDINDFKIRINELYHFSNFVMVKENKFMKLENKINEYKSYLLEIKNKIENEIKSQDTLIKDTYKNYLNDYKEIVNNFDIEENEISNIIVSINLLRELIEGKSYDIVNKEKEFEDKENNFNNKLKLLSEEDLKLFYANFHNEIKNNNSTIKSNIKNDRINLMNINSYIDEIKSSISKLKIDLSNNKNIPGNLIMNTNYYNNPMTSLMRYEKEHEHDVEMLMKTTDENFLLLSRKDINMFEEYLNTQNLNEISFKDTNYKKYHGHNRSTSLPNLIEDSPKIYKNNKKIIYRNASNPIIEKNEIKINKSKPIPQKCNTANKTIRTVSNFNNKDKTYIKGEKFIKVLKNNLKSTLNNNIEEKCKLKNTESKVQITEVNQNSYSRNYTISSYTSSMKKSLNNSTGDVSSTASSFKSRLFVDNKAKVNLNSKIFKK